jgi:hypothetical protein
MVLKAVKRKNDQNGQDDEKIRIGLTISGWIGLLGFCGTVIGLIVNTLVMLNTIKINAANQEKDNSREHTEINAKLEANNCFHNAVYSAMSDNGINLWNYTGYGTTRGSKTNPSK